MKIDIVPVYGKLLSSHISCSTVIVVDVLRSTSCITMAVKNGAERVIPAVDPGEAASIAGRLGLKDCVLAGERGGIKLPDFNLGNSPAEYSKENVQGKTVVISTSNGTAAIHGSSAAKDVLIGAMINRTAVARRALELGNDILIVCAGTDGAISADDLIAAGAIADAVCREATVAVIGQRAARIFPLRSIMPAWCAWALQRMSASALHQMLRTWCPFMKTGLSAKVLYCVFRFGRRFSSGRFVVCLQTISLQKQEAAILFWHWNKMRAASICLMRAMQ